MIIVSDIYQDAKAIVGTCDDLTLFNTISRAVQLLANKGDFDPLLGEVDICSYDGCITLPREVETVHAVNQNGRPGIGRGRWFNFHVNGPGDRRHLHRCDWGWQDGAESPIFRELAAPSKLVAFVTNAEDAGVELRVYGYDTSNNWIRTKENNEWVDGYRVPTVFGYAMPESGAPYFARIVRVKKALSTGTIRLTSLDVSATTGTFIGWYQWDETSPSYRRIHVACKVQTDTSTPNWIRVAFRRRVFKVRSLDDLIPLGSEFGLLEMIRAMKFYGDDDIVTGQGHEANAERFLTEEENSRATPIMDPIQIDPRNGVVDNFDVIE